MTVKKSKQEESYEEIKKELADIKQMLAERRHLDDVVKDIKHELDGNSKPGWKTIRDKVISWEVKVNALILAVAGDIVFRVIVLATASP